MIEITQNEDDEWVLFISTSAAKNINDAIEDYDPTIPAWKQEHKGFFGETHFPTLRETVEALNSVLPDLIDGI